MIAIQTAFEPPVAVVPEGRLLHIVDLENLVGSADFSETAAGDTFDGYLDVAPAGVVDQLIVATSHHAAAAAWFALPASARRLVRSGENGADLALLDVLLNEAIASRYDRVVIGSGDGIFAEAAARLQGAGAAVTVVTRRAALSRRLRLAVRDVRFLDPAITAPTSALQAVRA